MDKKLKQELAKNEIRAMKNPTILMNENDFECFKKEIESTTTKEVGSNPAYQGVPIKISIAIQKGQIVVYDDVFHKGLQWLKPSLLSNKDFYM